MIPDFRVSFGGSDSTEVIRPILEKIEIEDKVGMDVDACYITLKATEMLVIPETRTDEKMSLGYSSPNAEVWEVFKGFTNRGLPFDCDLEYFTAIDSDKQIQLPQDRLERKYEWNETFGYRVCAYATLRLVYPIFAKMDRTTTGEPRNALVAKLKSNPQAY